MPPVHREDLDATDVKCTIVSKVDGPNILKVSQRIQGQSIEPITAREEYEKNPQLKKSEIEELNKWVKSMSHLPPGITEELLIRFHHSCYFDIEATKKCINVYYSLKLGSPEYFIKRDVNTPSLVQALNVLEYGIFPVRDPNGYQIIFHRLQLYDASKYVFVDGVKCLAMAIDASLHVEGTAPGYVFIFDMKGVKLTHLTRLSVSSLRKFFLYVQEGMPVRLKAIHVLNTKPMIDKIMILIRPFMKKELMNMIHFHAADDLEEVYQWLPPYCLPSDFGGELPSCKELHANYCEWMGKLKNHFDEDERKYVTVNVNRKANPIKSSTDDFHDLAID